MADGFGIHDSFSGTTYNPFATLNGVGSLNPTLSTTGSVPITASTTTKSTSNSSDSWWGGILQSLATGGTNFLGTLASIDLFNRAQDAGVIVNANPQPQETATTSASLTTKLSQYAVPAGIAIVVLIVLFVLVRK